MKMLSVEERVGPVKKKGVPLIHHPFWISSMKPENYGVLLITSKALDARRQGVTTEAYGAIRRKEERSKATPLELAKSRLGGEMMP